MVYLKTRAALADGYELIVRAVDDGVPDDDLVRFSALRFEDVEQLDAGVRHRVVHGVRVRVDRASDLALRACGGANRALLVKADPVSVRSDRRWLPAQHPGGNLDDAGLVRS